MHTTLSQSRKSFGAQTSEADHLLDLISTPVIAEMAVWSGAPAGNDVRRDPVAEPAREWTPATWRILVDEVDGHAANADDPLDPWPSTYALYQEARARRAEAIAKLICDGTRTAREAIRRAWQGYRRRREARAIYAALVGLDDRTLRDLGFHRSEILSVAAEATGQAEQTRMLVRAFPRAPA
jgi:uncharacterized protein YjiS (DUF1127 family)